MPRGLVLPPGPSLYPECYRPGTSGERKHWVEGTVTCARCREEARRKLIRYRLRRTERGLRNVPALGAQRRIRALNRWGYNRATIGARMGVSQSAISRIMEQTTCFIETVEAIDRVYRDLVGSGIPGTSAKTRQRALAAGWAGPLDWDDIDNPDEVPLCEIEAAHAEALEIHKLIRKRERRALRTTEQRRVERTQAAARRERFEAKELVA